jgi:hypothetical protein
LPRLILNDKLSFSVTSPWSVKFYVDEKGNAPVQEFLDGLDKKRRAKVLALIALLAEQGAALHFPYSSQVRGKLRELRGTSRSLRGAWPIT